MRVVPSIAGLLLIATTALAQPGPEAGPGPDQPPPPSQGMGGHRGPSFDMANVTHDGRLTRDQAQAAGMMHVAQHFDEIDQEHKGFVTKRDIRAWRQAKRQARAAQGQGMSPGPGPAGPGPGPDGGGPGPDGPQ